MLNDIEHLPPNQRSALVMRELNGLEHEDIGAALDISPAASRQTVYGARLSLRELEAGRSMACAEAMKSVSCGNGRVRRGRQLRAHLRACEQCEVFRAGIDARQAALRSLVAFLPAAAAASIFGGFGGGGIGGGILAMFGGGTGAGVKAAAVVAVVAGVGGTAGIV
ncbi:MAG: sigma-70 region 4 domain-containing protein, partial [Solirubrobacterales bacterium]